jgi:arginyl-tRNA synthetase
MILEDIKKVILEIIAKEFELLDTKNINLSLNVDKPREFGDLNSNAAMVLAKKIKQSPQRIGEQIKEIILNNKKLSKYISSVEIAGAGFINIKLKNETWAEIAEELYKSDIKAFGGDTADEKRKKYLVEFVSANPTGPLHLGHGRGGIIGDVLSNVLNFIGHKADKEFYINDAGNQMTKLGESLKIRCIEQIEGEAYPEGKKIEFPSDGYAGEYLIELAKECIEKYGNKVIEKEDVFFEEYAKEKMLEKIKTTLKNYGIAFDQWFSEKRLHKGGQVEEALKLLKEKNLTYEKDDATWFASTKFGDDKDRVVKKADGQYTYIAADIAYHKDKFDRGYDVLVDVLGQDHHSYATRLKTTMEAIGEKFENLDIILYQLVTLKQAGEQVRMSKRAGKYETLQDIIETVGKDVARFFYLNRKADAHLEFDLETALKKTEENPVYYIQYAYVRTKSIFEKVPPSMKAGALPIFDDPEINVLKKICSLKNVLLSITKNYQIHTLSYYTLEFAKIFHNYYAKHKIIDPENIKTSQARLKLTKLVQQTLGLCLDLLGLSKPEKM